MLFESEQAPWRGHGGSSAVDEAPQLSCATQPHSAVSYSGTNSVHRTGHIDNLVAKPAERNPSAISDTSIYLPFREPTSSGLIRTNSATLKRRNLCHKPIGVHVDNLPRRRGDFQGPDSPGIPRAHSAAEEVENSGYAASTIPRATGSAEEVENPGYARQVLRRAQRTSLMSTIPSSSSPTVTGR